MVITRLSRYGLFFYFCGLMVYLFITKPEKKPVSPKDLKKITAVEWKRMEQPVPHFVSGDGKRQGFVTDEIPPKVRGYCDEVGVFIETDNNGRISGAYPIRYCETPYYFDIVKDSGFFEKLKGQSLSQPLKIDTVTGATVTSRAIIKDVEKSGVRFAKDVLKIPVVGRKGFHIPWESVLVVVILFAGILPRLYRKRWTGLVIQGISFIVIGVYLCAPVTVSAIGELMKGGSVFSSVAYLLAAGAFVLAFFYRNVYCQYVCPFGCAIDLAGAPVKTVFPIEARDAGIGRFVRDVITVIILSILLLAGDRRAGFVEPFAWLFSKALFGAFALTYGILTIAASVMVRRMWCYYLCPTGAIFSAAEQTGLKVREKIGRLFKRVGKFKITTALILLVLIVSGCGGKSGFSRDEQQPFDMAYYAEFVEYSSLKDLLPSFAASKYSIHLAVPSSLLGDSKTAAFLTDAEKNGVNVYLWLTLPYESGYWISETNIEEACELFKKFGQWNVDENLGLDGFVFDMEAPYEFAVLAQGGLTGITTAVVRLMDQINPFQYENSRAILESCIADLKQNFSLPVFAVTYPMVLDDLVAGGEGFQDLFGIPVAGLPWDEVGFMVYTTTFKSSGITAGPGIVKSYARDAVLFFGKKAAIGLGIAGNAGIGVHSGDASPLYFFPEIYCAAAEEISRFRIYSVVGILLDPDQLWFQLEKEAGGAANYSCAETPAERGFRKALISVARYLEEKRQQIIGTYVQE